MVNYINILDQIFSKLVPGEVAYLDYDDDGYLYRQSNHFLRLPNIYFDIKKSNFITPNDILKNIKVLTKLSSYDDNDHLISMTPTHNGFYFQVFNHKGTLVYAQSIKFFSLGKFGLWWAKKRFPELTLKVKKF